jgi:6-phosphogluconolactonase (cycloisomerase 2 family)
MSFLPPEVQQTPVKGFIMSRKIRPFWLMMSLLFANGLLFATTPVITVTSPKNNSTSTSPVQFKATATSSKCAQGISAVRVYSAPGVSAYTVGGGKLNAYLNLNAGTYNTTIVAWDNCGGTASVNVTVTASGEKKIGGFLYTVNSAYDYGNHNENNVSGFSIVASNGALAPLPQGPVNTNIFPQSVASDKGGYRLYVGDWQSGDVFPYFINRSNGSLTPVPGAPFAVNRSVTAVAVHPSGDFIYAAASEQASGDGIAVFQLQSDGSLKEIPGSPFPTQIGPQALTVDPSGNYLYVADYSSFIEAFQIDKSTGALTEAPGSPYLVSAPSVCNFGPGATVDPLEILLVAGARIYTPDAFIGYISGWSISSENGGLSAMSGSPWIDQGGCSQNNGNDPAPHSLAVDATGKFLYVNSGNFAEGISIYSIASDGALTYLKTTGNFSGCATPIRTDATGNYLYTGGCEAGVPGPGYASIVGYSINHSTGDITPLPASPFVYTSGTNAVLDSFTVTP